MEKLAQEKVLQHLETREGWSLEDEKWLVKKYRFPSFPAAVKFVNEIADISEEVNHHPFISIDFKMVTIRLTSWKAAGITELDIQCVDRYDSAAATA